MSDRSSVARAVGVLAACYLPGFISAATVDEIREDFPLGQATLGAAFAIYWGVAAVTSTPAARLTERIGPVAAIRIAGFIAAASCAAIAAFARSAPALMVLLAVGGTSISLAAPAANVIIVDGIRTGRRATVFAISQSSPPLGILLAGLAVPTLAQPLGWRPVYLSAAGLALCASLLIRRVPRHEVAARPVTVDRPSLRPLALIMVGVTAGNAAVGGMNAFLIDAASSAGVTHTAAAGVLVLGAGLTIVARVVVGVRADRSGRDPLPAVAMLLGGGAIGYALLAADIPALFVVGALFALVFGWVWISLFTYAVASRYATSVGPATGVMQTGFFAGGVLGPVGVGLIVESSSFSTGWLVLAVAMLIAAATVAVGRRALPDHPRSAASGMMAKQMLVLVEEGRR
jgi:MFS family permease